MAKPPPSASPARSSRSSSSKNKSSIRSCALSRPAHRIGGAQRGRQARVRGGTDGDPGQRDHCRGRDRIDLVAQADHVAGQREVHDLPPPVFEHAGAGGPSIDQDERLADLLAFDQQFVPGRHRPAFLEGGGQRLLGRAVEQRQCGEAPEDRMPRRVAM
jgi:hypothetical protein